MKNSKGGYIMIDMTGVDIHTRSTPQETTDPNVYQAVADAYRRRKPVIFTGLKNVIIDEMSHETTIPVGPVWAVIIPTESEYGPTYGIRTAVGVSLEVSWSGHTTVTIYK